MQFDKPTVPSWPFNIVCLSTAMIFCCHAPGEQPERADKTAPVAAETRTPVGGASTISGDESKPVLWGDLKPGAFNVSFRVIYRLDHSRTWKPKVDFRGSAVPGPRERPLRISVWYPAPHAKNQSRIAYRDYIEYKTEDSRFAEVNKLREARDIASTRRWIRGEEALRSLLATPMAAVADATPARGPFPLVLYSSGLNDIGQSGIVLSEFLASHGYVVATVPQLGTTAGRLNLGVNPLDLETQLRDIEFALAVVRELPIVDRDRLATIGHSMGGIVALLLAMRNSDVDAVVGLDASYGFRVREATMIKSHSYRPERMRVALMDLRRSDLQLDLAPVESLLYSRRYLLEFPQLYHADFTSFPMIALRFPTDMQGREPEVAAQGFQTVCRYVHHFLDAFVKGDARGREVIDGRPGDHGLASGMVKVRILPGLPAPPRAEEFARMVQHDGAAAASKVLREWQQRLPGKEVVDEAAMNSLGYEKLEAGDTSLAVALLTLNTEAHPTSANAYDSLAEAYLARGDKRSAERFYEKVLEVLAKDKVTSEEARTALQKNAADKLNELRRTH